MPTILWYCWYLSQLTTHKTFLLTLHIMTFYVGGSFQQLVMQYRAAVGRKIIGNDFENSWSLPLRNLLLQIARSINILWLQISKSTLCRLFFLFRELEILSIGYTVLLNGIRHKFRIDCKFRYFEDLIGLDYTWLRVNSMQHWNWPNLLWVLIVYIVLETIMIKEWHPIWSEVERRKARQIILSLTNNK